MSVIVYTENWDGKFKKITFEIASYASKLAGMLNDEAIAVSIGEVDHDQLSQLGKYGIKRVISAGGAQTGQFDTRIYSRILSELFTRESGKVMVLAHNNAGKSLAPRLSVRMKAAIASGVGQLPDSTSPFVIKKRVFSGNAFAALELTTEARIITLSQNAFDIVEDPVEVQVDQATVDLEGMTPQAELKDVEKQTGQLLLTDAEIVVSGGRGMKSPDNWAPIEELAELLNGATACSRPVSDEGWRPHEEHTGQTGKIIAPNLYFAIGISGATQHLAGISASKYIVAINNDKDAPIFDAAQYGIVGDASKILPKLVDALKAARSA